MSIVNLQNSPITVYQPAIEIDDACNQLRVLLGALPWIDFPYFIAQRFEREKNGRRYIYPEVYSRDVNTPDEKYPYHRLTPDNDYMGMFFFFVNDNTNAFQRYQYNWLTYDVAVIFSVNLESIDQVKLQTGLFTQELIRDARRVLTDSMKQVDFQMNIVRETRDLRTVYREFTLDNLEQYNRAPLQCFRFDIQIILQEQCTP